MKLRSPLTKWGLALLLALLSTFVYAAVDQGYEDANGVPGTCPTNGSAYTDAWGFSACNCTSYVAYHLRLNNVRHNGVLFGNTAWSGIQWSNANLWNDSTKLNNAGVRSDKYPAVGSVAHWNANENGAAAAGHVAYVQHLFTSPNDGKLTHIGVMEYNITPHQYTYRKIGVGRTNYPGRFLHFEEKGTDADNTNATCVSGLSSRPSAANVGTFCWKHDGGNASCISGTDHHHYDYRTCAKHPVTSSTTPSKSTLCNETTTISGTTGYTAWITTGFPKAIDDTVNGIDFAMCQSGYWASGTSLAVSGRLKAPRNKLWRDLSNSVLN